MPPEPLPVTQHSLCEHDRIGASSRSAIGAKRQEAGVGLPEYSSEQISPDALLLCVRICVDGKVSFAQGEIGTGEIADLGFDVVIERLNELTQLALSASASPSTSGNQ